jgi:hypothetical protein
VTAKHIVASLRDDAEGTIEIRKKSGWVSLKVRVFKCDEPVDIAVLVPPRQLTVDYQLEPTSAGLAVGADVYFVGFPFGSVITYETQPDVFAFVKRATVSAFEPSVEKKGSIIDLDGYNNPGFSGAPVVWRDPQQAGLTYRVVGVISGFIHDAGPVVRKTQEIRAEQVTQEDLQKGRVVGTLDGKLYRVEDTDQIVKLNTGIARAWDIYSAIALIRNHPLGPRAEDSFTGVE